MFWLPMLAGAGLGLAKSAFIDKPQADKQRKLAAATAAYSPWTGMTPQMPKDVDYLGPALQAGMTGAMLGQSMQSAENATQLGKLQQQYLENQNLLMQKQLGSGAINAANTGMPFGGGMQMGPSMIGAAPPPAGIAGIPTATTAVAPAVQLAQATTKANPYLTPDAAIQAQLYQYGYN